MTTHTVHRIITLILQMKKPKLSEFSNLPNGTQSVVKIQGLNQGLPELYSHLINLHALHFRPDEIFFSFNFD